MPLPTTKKPNSYPFTGKRPHLRYAASIDDDDKGLFDTALPAALTSEAVMRHEHNHPNPGWEALGVPSAAFLADGTVDIEGAIEGMSAHDIGRQHVQKHLEQLVRFIGFFGISYLVFRQQEARRAHVYKNMRFNDDGTACKYMHVRQSGWKWIGGAQGKADNLDLPITPGFFTQLEALLVILVRKPERPLVIHTFERDIVLPNTVFVNGGASVSLSRVIAFLDSNPLYRPHAELYRLQMRLARADLQNGVAPELED